MTKLDILLNLMEPLKQELSGEGWSFLVSRCEKFVEQMRLSEQFEHCEDCVSDQCHILGFCLIDDDIADDTITI